ncbi:MAG: transglutaminase domain-containing protein [Vulcanimicrobiota bacterium]
MNWFTIRPLVLAAVLALTGCHSPSGELLEGGRTPGATSTVAVRASLLVSAELQQKPERNSPELTLALDFRQRAPERKLRVRWKGPQGLESDDTKPLEHRRLNLSVRKPPSGWPAGDYTIEIFLDGDSLKVIDFEIEADPNSTVARLAKEVTANSTDDQAKVEAIFGWVARNIDYDAAAFVSGDYGDCSAEAVLARRTGVCSGYANLFYAMAQTVGLEVEVIPGYARGYGLGEVDLDAPANHAWNAVKLGGQWRLLDCTWGAGFLDERQAFIRRYEEFWLFTPPGQFARSHLPDEPRWQLLDKPISRQAFMDGAQVLPAFFKYGLDLGTHDQYQLASGSPLVLDIGCPEDVHLSAQLEGVEGRNVLVESRPGGQHIEVLFPRPGDYTLRIFAGPQSQTKLAQAVTYQVRASQGDDRQFPEFYADYVKQGARLSSPRAFRLFEGHPQEFRLSAPGAQEVVLVGDDGQPRPLSQRGQEFTLDITPPRGKLTIYARYGEDRRMSGLVSFEVK